MYVRLMILKLIGYQDRQLSTLFCRCYSILVWMITLNWIMMIYYVYLNQFWNLANSGYTLTAVKIIPYCYCFYQSFKYQLIISVGKITDSTLLQLIGFFVKKPISGKFVDTLFRRYLLIWSPSLYYNTGYISTYFF